MLFLPYKMDSRKSGIPIFTAIICLACILVFWKQYDLDKRHETAASAFCSDTVERRDVSFLQNIAHTDSGNPCRALFESIRSSDSPTQYLSELANNAPPTGLFASDEEEFVYAHHRLGELYNHYDIMVPNDLTTNLVYDPNDIDLWKMVTSTFSHADIFHLLGNLLFFYIFSLAVELIVGNLAYFGFIALATLGTSLSYSYVMYGVEGALPTLGLSGVVMASLTALAVMMPYAQIKCFFWFFVYFRVFHLPAMLIAIWYVGWDLYNANMHGTNSYINYTAHISGAAMGAVFGMFYRFFRKDLLRRAARDY